MIPASPSGEFQVATAASGRIALILAIILAEDKMQIYVENAAREEYRGIARDDSLDLSNCINILL